MKWNWWFSSFMIFMVRVGMLVNNRVWKLRKIQWHKTNKISAWLFLLTNWPTRPSICCIFCCLISRTTSNQITYWKNIVWRIECPLKIEIILATKRSLNYFVQTLQILSRLLVNYSGSFHSSDCKKCRYRMCSLGNSCIV